MKKAIFGGGCFWCTEAVFKMLKGVHKVLPGYSGGVAEDATYDQVSSGKTHHAEVTYIEYDESEISYKDLLTVFFASHDPTTYNRQGNDIGPQYRSIIFYTTEEQKEEAEKFIEEINLSNKEGEKVVTELEPLDKFYEAEEYHKDYYATHSMAPYCQVIINPKLEKVQMKFAELLKQG
jgi:peptide-methionine (S)-S-oxide reductase